MTDSTVSNFLKSVGISHNPSELAHYGVKGMQWGVRRSDKDGDGLVDKAFENFNGGGDIDDLDLETTGAAVDALLDGRDPETNLKLERVVSRDSDDKFWERTGRNVEDFLGDMFGSKAQKSRNIKLASIAGKPFNDAKAFVADLFKKKK